MDKRASLIEAASKLTYQNGFHQTTLADIAQASGVPLGNVYYYFKTKEALGEALVGELAQQFEQARAEWSGLSDPRARVEAFIQMTLANQNLSQSGCPVGTLCTELHKSGGALADQAGAILAASLRWLEQQFKELGQGRKSSESAIHVLSSLEGASLLTHVFHSTKYITAEANRLKAWLRSL